jgi:hypothetical protein
MECGKKVCQEALESANIRMEAATTVIGSKDSLMVWARKFFRMELFLMADGSTERQEVTAKRF